MSERRPVSSREISSSRPWTSGDGGLERSDVLRQAIDPLVLRIEAIVVSVETLLESRESVS